MRYPFEAKNGALYECPSQEARDLAEYVQEHSENDYVPAGVMEEVKPHNPELHYSTALGTVWTKHLGLTRVDNSMAVNAIAKPSKVTIR